MMMTMVGDPSPLPPWSSDDRRMAGFGGYHLPVRSATLAALWSYIPCFDSAAGEEVELNELDVPVDAYSKDEFRMYDFKVRRCTMGRSHDWTECPYAHPGEKARRRDPRRFHYSGVACPDFRKGGGCKRGDACEFAHGVFECWLHPARYRTQPCKDGTACRRPVCFFAHTLEQLRLLTNHQQLKSPAVNAVESYDGSPSRQQAALESYITSMSHLRMATSPTSALQTPPVSPPSESPPVSPDAVGQRWSSWPVAAGSSVKDLLSPLGRLHLSSSLPSSWTASLQPGNASGYGSPSGAYKPCSGSNAAGYGSLPATPTMASAVGWWDTAEEAVVERVESGRGVRAKMVERLSKESLVQKDKAAVAGVTPTSAGSL